MGRPLRLACDNCIPGDASGWYLPLGLATLACLGLAVACMYVAARRGGVRAISAKVAAVTLVVGPVGGIVAMATDVTFDGAICGSALSTSRDRPLPGHRLDPTQEGCRRKGEAIVRGASVWALTSAGAAALLLAGSSLPPRRVAFA